MFLGKITFKIEIKNNPKWMYSRPIAYANSQEFPSRIGICHVVHVEKSFLTENYERDGIYTSYAIFDKIETEEKYNTGYINVKISLITEEVYNLLKEIYPQNNHLFLE